MWTQAHTKLTCADKAGHYDIVTEYIIAGNALADLAAKAAIGAFGHMKFSSVDSEWRETCHRAKEAVESDAASDDDAEHTSSDVEQPDKEHTSVDMAYLEALQERKRAKNRKRRLSQRKKRVWLEAVEATAGSGGGTSKNEGQRKNAQVPKEDGTLAGRERTTIGATGAGPEREGAKVKKVEERAEDSRAVKVLSDNEDSSSYSDSGDGSDSEYSLEVKVVKKG
jgi:hypothetical protein